MSIPAMTDPRGRHWDQPADIHEAPMDDEIVLLTFRQFVGLHDYSAFMPTGVYERKCWRAGRLGRWYLRWYGPGADLAHCSLNQRLIEVVR